jgi:hypothetical protein
MNFIIFLWNTFVKFLEFLLFIALEIIVFDLIIEAVDPVMPVLSAILKIIFSLWLITEIALRILVGGTKSLIRYIFNF